MHFLKDMYCLHVPSIKVRKFFDCFSSLNLMIENTRNSQFEVRKCKIEWKIKNN